MGRDGDGEGSSAVEGGLRMASRIVEIRLVVLRKRGKGHGPAKEATIGERDRRGIESEAWNGK